MGILSIFKKKKQSNDLLNNQNSLLGLNDLPPIDESISNPDKDVVVGTRSSRKISAVEAFANHSIDKLPESDDFYKKDEEIIISLPDSNNKTNDLIEPNKNNDDSIMKSTDKTNGEDQDLISVPSLDSTKEITYDDQTNPVLNKDSSKSKSFTEDSTSEVKNVYLHQETKFNSNLKNSDNFENTENVFVKTKNHLNDSNSISSNSSPNTNFNNESKVSFDDLPLFSDEELADESPEVISFPDHPNLADVRDIFVEKHKYAKMFTSWNHEVDELRKNSQAEKSFDHYDEKLQSSFTRANVAFAQIQKKLLFAEKILTQTKID